MQRNENETIKDYKIRLCENKDIMSFSWQNIADIINKETGDSFSESSYRKWWASFQDGREYQKKKALDSDTIIKEYDVKRIAFEKERQRFFDQRTAYNKDVRVDARHDELRDIIERTIDELPDLQFEYNEPVLISSDNDLMVSLHDLHYGADVHNAWNTYNSDVCKMYLEQYLEKILRIQKMNNSEKCYVFANGDLISGSIHVSIQVENKENVIQQVIGVSELIGNFLYELSKYFTEVIFSVVAGNHSRLGKKDESLYQERLDDFVPWWLSARLQNVENVTFIENMDTTMNVVNIRGKRYLGVHGDYDRGQQALENVSMMGGNEIYAICCGHKHHNSTDFLNRTKILMAGSFIGMDSYCVEKRIVGIPQQMVCVCTRDGVEAVYDVNFKNK